MPHINAFTANVTRDELSGARVSEACTPQHCPQGITTATESGRLGASESGKLYTVKAEGHSREGQIFGSGRN